MREPPFVQGSHRRRRIAGTLHGLCRGGLGLGLGGLAGLQRDGVRGHSSGPQSRGQASYDMLVGQVPAQQQHFDQGPGAVPLPVNLLGLVPPSIMDRGELACRPGLFEGGGAGESAGLANQDLQIVVQFQADGTLGDQPLVPGHFHVPVVNHQVRGVQHGPHPFPDQPDRDRIAVVADRDLPVSVDPWREQPPGLERLIRQRPQQQLFEREVLRDRLGPGPDAAGIVLPVPLLDHLIQLGERGDLGDRNEVVAAEVADLSLDPAFLMGALDARPAVEAFDTEVRLEGDPPIRLHPGPAQSQHLGHGGLEIVVADLAPRDPAQRPQRVHMAFEEGFLAAGGEHPMDGLARIRQAEGEQVAGHQLAGQPHTHVAEVDFRLMTGLVGLRDERLQRRLAGLDQDFRLPAGNVVADHSVGDVRPVFFDQPVKDPGDRVPLLARRVEVRPQDLVDRRLERIQGGGTGRELLARLRPGRVQRLPHRPPRHAVLALKLPHRHAAPMVTPDRRVQLDLRHPRHDQHLSPRASRCCPGKRPGASQTHQHHPTVDRGASQTHRQVTSLLLDKASAHTPGDASGASTSPLHRRRRPRAPGFRGCPRR